MIFFRFELFPKMSSSSRFSELTQDPPIEVFELTRQFNEDTHPNKVNLGVGCKKNYLYFFYFNYYLDTKFFVTGTRSKKTIGDITISDLNLIPKIFKKQKAKLLFCLYDILANNVKKLSVFFQ